ncbi:hypothetical protein BDR07DRAFT_1319078, partial [Suillus spraguei]
GYGADDLDIAMLIFRLGGHQLLFALNHKLSLPSLCTLHLKSSFASLMSTITPFAMINSITIFKLSLSILMQLQRPSSGKCVMAI